MANPTQLELDLFRMQVEAITSKLVRLKEAPKEFVKIEADKVNDLIQIALAQRLTWRNWDSWIKNRVKEDLAAYKSNSTAVTNTYGTPNVNVRPDARSQAPDTFGRPAENYARQVDNYAKSPENYARPVDTYTNPVGNYERPVDSYSRPPDNYTRPVDNYTRPVDSYTRPVDNYTSQVGNNYGRPVDNYAPADTYSRNVDTSSSQVNTYGGPAAYSGQTTSNYGKPVDTYVTPAGNYGQPVNNYTRQVGNESAPVTDYVNRVDNYAKPVDNYYARQVGNESAPVTGYGSRVDNYVKPVENYANQTANYSNQAGTNAVAENKFNDFTQTGVQESQEKEVRHKIHMEKFLRVRPPKIQWTCTWCKYQNPPKTMSCKACMCRCPRELLNRPPLKPGQWVCLRCGCKNPPELQISCQSCGLVNHDPKRAFIPDDLKENPLALLGAALKRYDISGDNSLNKKELFKVLKLFDDTLTFEQIKACYKRLDSDDSGEISLVELFTGMVHMANDRGSPMNRVMRGIFDQMFNPKYTDRCAGNKGRAHQILQRYDEDTSSSESTSDSDVNQGKSALTAVRKAFVDADTNHDGQLNMAEFENAAAAIGVNEELAQQLFRKLDDDGSGSLDMEEFSEAIIELAELDAEQFGKAATRIFLRGLTDIAVERKAAQIEHLKNFRRNVARQINVEEDQLIETRQDDLLMMRQRKKEMKHFRDLLQEHKGYKYRDRGRVEHGGEPHPFEGRGWQAIDNVMHINDVDVSSKKVFKYSHVSQGELGDCYFLTSLSLLATRPGLIQKLILTNRYSAEGVHKFRFCKDGVWVVVTIDDRLPINQYGLIQNAQPVKDDEEYEGKNVFWVSLLEKAWAKLFGSFEVIEAGLIGETLSDLTGAPSETFDTHDPDFDNDLMFHKLFSFNELGYLLGAGSGTSEEDVAYFKNAGLVEGHAYTLLRVVHLDHGKPNGDELELIKLRNPWGEGEWNGRYSDGSPQMTDELAAKLDHIEVDDGSFWMEYGDFLNFFRTITVCKVVPTWQFVTLPTHFRIGSLLSTEAYLVNIDRPTQCYVSCIQPDTRGKDHLSYTEIGILILKCDGTDPTDTDDYEFEAVIWPTIERYTTTEVCFTDVDDTYLIFPFQFNTAKEVNFTISIYSANPVILSRTKPTHEALRVGTHLAVEEYRENPKLRIKRFKNKKGADLPVEYMTLSVGHAIYVIVNNMHKKFHFFFKMDYSKTQGMISERDGVMKTVDAIPPMSRQILTVVVCEDVTVGYAWGVGFAFGYKRKAPAVPHNPPLEDDDIYIPLKNTNIALKRQMDEAEEERKAMEED
jgi:Ca2+-binding EF-hand superfamily protein